MRDKKSLQTECRRTQLAYNAPYFFVVVPLITLASSNGAVISGNNSHRPSTAVMRLEAKQFVAKADLLYRHSRSCCRTKKKIRTYCKLLEPAQRSFVVACRHQLEVDIRWCKFCRCYHKLDLKPERMFRCRRKQLDRLAAPRKTNRNDNWFEHSQGLANI